MMEHLAQNYGTFWNIREHFGWSALLPAHQQDVPHNRGCGIEVR
jgi:hypothetical protein